MTEEEQRALDAAVAEQVMGWEPSITDLGLHVWEDAAGNIQAAVAYWQPSTDWADAGRVLDLTQMLETYWWFLGQYEGAWYIYYKDYDDLDEIARGATGPEAISRAALVWAKRKAAGA